MNTHSVGVCVWLVIWVWELVWKSKRYINMLDYIFIPLLLPLYSGFCKKEPPEQVKTLQKLACKSKEYTKKGLIGEYPQSCEQL